MNLVNKDPQNRSSHLSKVETQRPLANAAAVMVSLQIQLDLQLTRPRLNIRSLNTFNEYKQQEANTSTSHLRKQCHTQ